MPDLNLVSEGGCGRGEAWAGNAILFQHDESSHASPPTNSEARRRCWKLRGLDKPTTHFTALTSAL